MGELRRPELAERCWSIEEYHRALKRCCNVERCQARAQRNHIGMAIRAFARLSWHFYTTGVSWYETKTSIVREAIRAYRSRPLYRLPPTAYLLWHLILGTLRSSGSGRTTRSI